MIVFPFIIAYIISFTTYRYFCCYIFNDPDISPDTTIMELYCLICYYRFFKRTTTIIFGLTNIELILSTDVFYFKLRNVPIFMEDVLTDLFLIQV